MDTRFLAFLGVAALLTLTPGADTAIVTRITIEQGRRAALFTTLGINTGVMSWALASALGLAALLTASTVAFTALKLAGAAYLFYLGFQALRHARRPAAETEARQEAGVNTSASISSARAYRQGLFTNLLNPKVGVFYMTFLPQFIAPGDPVFLFSLLLAGLHNVMGFAWLTTYAYLLGKASAVVRRPAVRAALDRLTGVVLLGFGVRLVVEQR